MDQSHMQKILAEECITRNHIATLALKFTAIFYGLKIKDLTGRDKHEEYVIPRHFAIQLAWDNGVVNKSLLARRFDRHSSLIIAALRANKVRWAANDRLRVQYSRLSELFNKVLNEKETTNISRKVGRNPSPEIPQKTSAKEMVG